MSALEWCEFCWSVRKLFKHFDIPYQSIDLDFGRVSEGELGRFASSSRNSSAVVSRHRPRYRAPRLGSKRAQRCAHDRASSSKRSLSAIPNTGSPHDLTVVAGYELMACAAMAWYIMAHLIFADVFGRDVLPVGKPWLDIRRIEPEQIVRSGVQEAEVGA